jgi:hypothetical protein
MSCQNGSNVPAPAGFAWVSIATVTPANTAVTTAQSFTSTRPLGQVYDLMVINDEVGDVILSSMSGGGDSPYGGENGYSMTLASNDSRTRSPYPYGIVPSLGDTVIATTLNWAHNAGDGTKSFDVYALVKVGYINGQKPPQNARDCR